MSADTDADLLDCLADLMRDAYNAGYQDGERRHGGDFDWTEARRIIGKMLHNDGGGS